MNPNASSVFQTGRSVELSIRDPPYQFTNSFAWLLVLPASRQVAPKLSPRGRPKRMNRRKSKAPLEFHEEEKETRGSNMWELNFELSLQINHPAGAVVRNPTKPERTHPEQSVEFWIRASRDEIRPILAEVHFADGDVRRGKHLNANAFVGKACAPLRSVPQSQASCIAEISPVDHQAIRPGIYQHPQSLAPELDLCHRRAGSRIVRHGDPLPRNFAKFDFPFVVVQMEAGSRQHVHSNNPCDLGAPIAFELRKILDLHRHRNGAYRTEFNL